MKSRLPVDLDPVLMAQLTELAKRRHQSMSDVAEDAIASFLTPDEDDRREAEVSRRLDRLSRQFHRFERDLAVSVEATALFIRYWLMLTPSIPDDFQAAAQARGRERFASFVKMLAQRLAAGRREFHDVAPDSSLDPSPPLRK